MKNLPMKLTLWPLILAVMLFGGVAVTAQAQTNHFPRNPIVPVFTNNPLALSVISNLLAAPRPPLSMPVISRTNNAPGGTYWTLSAPAPLPFNPYPDLPTYQVSTNPDFIIDDRSIDYAELDAENATNNPITFQPQGLTIDTNSLYLEVPPNSLATPNEFDVILHNTLQGRSYDFLTKFDLLSSMWMTQLTTTGAVGNATEVLLPQNGRTNLFVWARESTNTGNFYINIPPMSQTVEDGDSVTFSVDTGGNPNLTFQWTFNGVDISGATNSSYTINNVQDSDAGAYAVIISDGTNSVTTPPAQLTTDSSNSLGFTQTGDYNLIPILSSRQDYTFKNGNTYYIPSVISFYGRTTIEGGSVIKPDWYSGGSVQIMGTLVCQTEPYFPAFLTSVDDDSVGEVLGFSGQDGPPQTVPNGVPYLDLIYAQSNAISNLRFCFADQGVTTPELAQGLDVWDCQFLQCNYGVFNSVSGGNDSLHNVLFAACGAAIGASTNSITIEGEQVTADVTHFCSASTTPSRIALTNSLYWGTTVAASSLSTINVNHNPNGTNFASEGYGNYYLAKNSSLHQSGTASISPRLQSELQSKTTYSPIPIAVNTQITGDLTLSPQALRYTNGAPDLGYYYDALDYTVANLTLAGGNLTVLPNTAIAVRNEYIATNSTYTIEGFFVHEGSSIISHGTPNKPNIFTAEKMVQETPETSFAAYKNSNGWWFGAITFVTDSEPNTDNTPAPTYDFRFSKFFLPSGDYHFWSGYDEYGQYELSPDSSMYLSLQDCHVHGGRINLGNPDQSYYSPSQVYAAGGLSWINNSFENTAINLDPTYNEYGYGVNSDMQLLAYNNLFQGGTYLRMEPIPASAGNWTFQDNLFDKVNLLQDASQPLNFDHNGYWPLLPREFLYAGSAGELAASTGGTDGGNEVTLSNAPPYQVGVFGKFYLPDTTPLYSAGSTNAAGLGLYHYTTRLDQTKEGDEVSGHMVNIGLHYIAANGNQPKDTDADGIPDYIEDANGNGVVDFNAAANANETDPANSMTDGVTNDIYNIAYDNLDLSGNGLVGRVKKALNMNPLDINNPLVATQITTGEEPRIATFSVPVSFNLLTNIGRLNLTIDGVAVSAQECDPNTNGNCILKWNTTFNSPGQHYYQAQLTVNGQITQGATPISTILIGAGTLGLFYSTNICQFDSFYSTFNGNNAILYATTPACPDADYTIELQTASGQHIKTITNSTSSGVISENWDLTDDNGNLITNNIIKAVFNVTLLDPAAGSLDFWFQRALTETTDANFTTAFAWDEAIYANGTMNYAVQGGVVDNVLSPVTVSGGADDYYTSTFNRYTGQNYPDDPGNPGQLSSGSDVTNLLNNLDDVDTMNFHFIGHGNPQAIGDNKNDAVTLSAVSVASTLNNWYSPLNGNWSSHPYRFVFLDACETANDDFWTHAFGIEDNINSTELDTKPLGAQAFIGWVGSPRAPDSDSEWTEEGDTLAVFYESWMLGYNVQECIDFASSTNPYGDGAIILDFPLGKKFNIFQNWYGLSGLNNFHVKVYGYRGLKRYDYDDGY